MTWISTVLYFCFLWKLDFDGFFHSCAAFVLLCISIVWLCARAHLTRLSSCWFKTPPRLFGSPPHYKKGVFTPWKGRKKGEVETNCRLPLVKQTSSRGCEMMRLGEIYWFSTLLLFLLPPFVVSFWPTTMKEFVLNAKQQQPNGAGRSLIIFMLFYIQNYMCRGFPIACFLQDLVCVCLWYY